MSDVQEQPPVENPFVNAQPPVEPQAPEVELQEPQVEQPVDPVHTHESILNGLMLELEGMTAMSKSEVEATIAAARAKYETL